MIKTKTPNVKFCDGEKGVKKDLWICALKHNQERYCKTI